MVYASGGMIKQSSSASVGVVGAFTSGCVKIIIVRMNEVQAWVSWRESREGSLQRHFDRSEEN